MIRVIKYNICAELCGYESESATHKRPFANLDLAMQNALSYYQLLWRNVKSYHPITNLSSTIVAVFSFNSFILVSNCIQWCHWYFHVSLTGIYQHAQKHMFRFMSFHAGAAAPTDSGSSMHLFGFTWLPKSVPSHCRRLRWQESNKVRYCGTWCPGTKSYIALCRLHQWATALQCWDHDVHIYHISRKKQPQRGTMHRV